MAVLQAQSSTPRILVVGGAISALIDRTAIRNRVSGQAGIPSRLVSLTTAQITKPSRPVRRRLRDRTKALSKSLSGTFETEISGPSSRHPDGRGTSLPGKVMEDVLIAAVEAPRWSAAKWTVDGASRQPGFNGNLINGQRHAGDFERFGQRGK